jgi:hypothetical protein
MPSQSPQPGQPGSENDWSLVTAPDERERCCVVDGGMRCEQPTAWIVRGAGGELDEVTHVCEDHLALVRRTGDVVERV